MKKKVGLWHQVGLTFFIVSGGPYGLEAAVGSLGPGLAFLFVLLVPVFWVVPICLMVSELSSMMPESGGYYFWVKRALGRGWAFQEGWWTLCYSAVDLAIYPVLFVTYLSYFFPGLIGPASSLFYLRWAIGATFVLCALILNLRGSRLVGLHSFVEMLLVSIPFCMLILAAFFLGDIQNLHLAVHDLMHPHALAPTGLAAGLAVILWNYSGWDNVSTYADEVETPSRTIPKAVGLTVVLVMISYAIPLIAGYKSTVVAKDWGESSGWPEIASHLGLSWLGTLMAVMALVSSWALFNGQLLYLARLPKAMAKDRLLPVAFAKTSDSTGVPTVAVFFAAGVSILFCGLSLGKLMIVDMLAYTLGLSLEFISLIHLRRSEPQLERPFKIPLPTWGLVALSISPMLLALFIAVFSVLGDEGSYMQVAVVAVAVAAGFVVYRFFISKSDMQVEPSAFDTPREIEQ